MKIDRKLFISELSSVMAGVSQQEDFAQSSCFLFKQGLLMTLNEEIFCKRPTIADQITCAVPAEPLITLLNKLKEDEIEIWTDKDYLIIKGKGKEAGIKIDLKIEAPISNVDSIDGFKKLNADFLTAVSKVHQSASADTSQFSLTCINLTDRFIEACDNFRLARFMVETGLKENIMVKQKSIKHLPGLGPTGFGVSQSYIHFRRKSDGLVLALRRYDHDYPDLERFLEMKGVKWMPPKGLKDAADVSKIFTGEAAKAAQLELTLSPGKVRMFVRGEKGYYKTARKIDYEGKKLKFRISPDMLIELVNDHNEVLINTEKIKVDGGRFQFVASLESIEEKENDIEPESDSDSEE